jgi:hypothetical protein
VNENQLLSAKSSMSKGNEILAVMVMDNLLSAKYIQLDVILDIFRGHK